MRSGREAQLIAHRVLALRQLSDLAVQAYGASIWCTTL